MDAFGEKAERDEISLFVRLLWRRGSLFEQETISKLQIPFVDVSGANEVDRERLTLGGYIAGDIKSGRGKEGGDDKGHAGSGEAHREPEVGIVRSREV